MSELTEKCEGCGEAEPAERYWFDSIGFYDLCQRCIDGIEQTDEYKELQDRFKMEWVRKNA